MKRFGDDKFYEYLSEGYFSVDPSKSYENFAYSSPGANMEERLGKTAAKLFNLEDKRSFQDKLLKQEQPAKEDSENVSSASVIDSMVPLANMFGYVNNLRSLSQGRANYTMQFNHYEQVPSNVVEEVKAKLA